MTKLGKNTGGKDEVKYPIPKKGSLGLFAFGDKGLRAWREVKDEPKNAKKND